MKLLKDIRDNLAGGIFIPGPPGHGGPPGPGGPPEPTPRPRLRPRIRPSDDDGGVILQKKWMLKTKNLMMR